MSLLDHSFHDFDIDLWIKNFEDLPEPEYVLHSMDDLVLSTDSEELRALLRKDNPEKSTYDTILDVLKDQKLETLFIWMLDPEQFIEDTGISVDDPNYIRFLSEIIPGYVLYRNQWDRNQLGIELRNYISNWNQPDKNRKTRLKKCHACGYNITDLFAMKLTADNILDDTPVVVVCPHCNMPNYVKF